MKILLFVSLGLLIALGICILIIRKQLKDIKAYKNTLNHLEKILRTKDEIENKKEEINTDNSIDNFNTSIQFLSEYAKRNQ